MTDREILAAALPRIADWDAAVRRDLPWRRSPTPYHVWSSEIMLQQTRIEAVIPYYERFLAALPDVAALAAVDDDRLMKLWEGLGYYSRARNLKKAAQQVIERFGGALPATAEELRSLPGIGEYTAGAIASLAFHKPEPAVDGNVLRVLSRLLASKDDIMSPAVRKAVTEQLRTCYPAGERAALFPASLSIDPCSSAKHIFTHVEWHMTGWRVELPEEAPGYVWETAETIRTAYSVPTALKYYLKQL